MIGVLYDYFIFGYIIIIIMIWWKFREIKKSRLLPYEVKLI